MINLSIRHIQITRQYTVVFRATKAFLSLNSICVNNFRKKNMFVFSRILLILVQHVVSVYIFSFGWMQTKKSCLPRGELSFFNKQMFQSIWPTNSTIQDTQSFFRCVIPNNCLLVNINTIMTIYNVNSAKYFSLYIVNIRIFYTLTCTWYVIKWKILLRQFHVIRCIFPLL